MYKMNLHAQFSIVSGLCVCMCLCVHVCVSVCVHTCVHTVMHTYICAHHLYHSASASLISCRNENSP